MSLLSYNLDSINKNIIVDKILFLIRDDSKINITLDNLFLLYDIYHQLGYDYINEILNKYDSIGINNIGWTNVSRFINLYPYLNDNNLKKINNIPFWGYYIHRNTIDIKNKNDFYENLIYNFINEKYDKLNNAYLYDLSTYFIFNNNTTLFLNDMHIQNYIKYYFKNNYNFKKRIFNYLLSNKDKYDKFYFLNSNDLFKSWSEINGFKWFI